MELKEKLNQIIVDRSIKKGATNCPFKVTYKEY